VVNVNGPCPHRSLECGMITLSLICVGQCKFAHRSIEFIAQVTAKGAKAFNEPDQNNPRQQSRH
jgi:hypothetical protein